MRVREVWVHAVDLGARATFHDIDQDVAAELLDEASMLTTPSLPTKNPVLLMHQLPSGWMYAKTPSLTSSVRGGAKVSWSCAADVMAFRVPQTPIPSHAWSRDRAES